MTFRVFITQFYHKNWLLRQQKATSILHFAFCILKLTAKLQFTQIIPQTPAYVNDNFMQKHKDKF